MPRLATSPRHSDKSTARSVLARPVARARLKFVDSTPNLVDECLICYESTARRIPCCTARVCQRCAKGLSKCPICRVALLDEDIELCFEVASEGELRTRIREAVHLSALALICLRGRSPQEVEFFQDLLLYKALRIIRTLPLESFAFESERLVELIEQHNFDRNLVSEEIEDRLLHLVETSDKAKWAAAVVRLQSLALVNLSEILAMDEIRVARTRLLGRFAETDGWQIRDQWHSTSNMRMKTMMTSAAPTAWRGVRLPVRIPLPQQSHDAVTVSYSPLHAHLGTR
eukprot:GEMP01066649.1.p1 GENE.GEMP01066649.1~~GEMP01066649.1.p1  ORF type:complete len:295 (-),score=51.57 GEMP01066649.1:420-1277(-)